MIDKKYIEENLLLSNNQLNGMLTKNIPLDKEDLYCIYIIYRRML